MMRLTDKELRRLAWQTRPRKVPHVIRGISVKHYAVERGRFGRFRLREIA